MEAATFPTLILISLSMLSRPLTAELFSSMAGLEEIFYSHQTATDMLKRYIEDEEHRLDQLRKISANGGISDFAHTLQLLMQSSTSTPSASVTSSPTPVSNLTISPPNAVEMIGGMNPISVYRAMKRFTIDQQSTLALIQRNTADSHLRSMYDATKMGLASNADLLGAAQAIVRLQDTYNLKTEDIANGRTHESHVPMNVDDCFEIAQQMFTNQDYYHALQWLMETESRLPELDLENPGQDDMANEMTFNRTVLYDYLTYSMHSQRNLEHAVFYSRMMSSIDPDYPTASYLAIYEQMLRHSNSTWDGTRESLPPVNLHQVKAIEYPGYEELCRGEEINIAPKATPETLICYYRTDAPFLRLARVKYERLYADPEVIVIRDLLADWETETLKALAQPHLRRALVVNNQRNSDADPANVAAGFRVAQNMWMQEEGNAFVLGLTKRVDLATGLDQSKAELWQIANYGVGGHYEPHYDMATEDQRLDLNDAEHGNRIATLLVYLTDVEAGGATVFTELGIGVRPSKNDALFWHNVQYNGRPDLRTRHAACPVLHGTKWVANKWIHERGQEWRRPCKLDDRM